MDNDSVRQRIENRESFLIADDGQYLGKLSLNQYDVESISNPYGFYGSQYSPTSIYNQYGNYGSPYSSLSPFNQYSRTPPKIILHGRILGYLTKNVYMNLPIVDPDNIVYWLRDQRLEY